MAQCRYHPGRPSVSIKFGQPYCQQCTNGITSAVQQVDAHVEPKDCFVEYDGADDWSPITGTGCAHWVAHQLGTNAGLACLATRTIQVTTLVSGKAEIARANVAVNDIWANTALDHCGLVVGVTSGGAKITIRHDSSAQGGVRDNDFDQYFQGQGKFYR